MKIAVYHNSPGGGAKRALYNFARELSKRHELEEFTLSTANPYLPLKYCVSKNHVYEMGQIKLPRIRPYLLDCLRNLRQVQLTNALYERVNEKVAKDINSRDFDVVLVDMCLFAHAPHILKYLTPPKLYYCHDPFRALYEPEHFTNYKLNNQPWAKNAYSDLCEKILFCEQKFVAKVDKENFMSADLILTNSYYTREYIHKAYGKLVDVNYLAVDTDLFRKVSDIKGDYVMSVGRLFKQKGHDLVIRALALVPKETRPKLLIAGDKSEEDVQENLYKLATKLDVNLKINELVTDEELVKLYNEAKAVVFVPVMEPFGFVPLEAMACGTAVIGIREGGVPESIIHDQTGLLVDRDEKELAETITRLLNDEPLRKKLEQGGLDHVRAKWTWPVAAQNLERKLQQLITSSKN